MTSAGPHRSPARVSDPKRSKGFARDPAVAAVAAVVRRFLVQALMGKERREASLILDDGETRYREFLATSPGLEGRVMQKHIASYLALSPVSLSRIRRRMART